MSRLMMLDKKLWPTLIYSVLLFIVCVSVWQLSEEKHVYNSNSSYSYSISTLPLDDYHQIIDLQNFTFSIFNSPCNDFNPLLLILVHSHPKNSNKRQILRETWAQNTPQVKTLFMTGIVKDKILQWKLQQENEKHGDLIQGSFVDAYRNMTYKHVMVFKYAIYHCPQAKYILKTDDDVFVNMPLMMNFLTMELSTFGGLRKIFCSVIFKGLVMRDTSKWKVSFKEYPDKIYPPYCQGWAILYSQDVVFDLYKEAQRSEYFWIDDVHITGTLVKKVRLSHVNIHTSEYFWIDDGHFTGTLVKKVRLSHVNIDTMVLTEKDTKDVLKYSKSFNKSFLYGPPNINQLGIKALWDYVKNQHNYTSVIK